MSSEHSFAWVVNILTTTGRCRLNLSPNYSGMFKPTSFDKLGAELAWKLNWNLSVRIGFRRLYPRGICSKGKHDIGVLDYNAPKMKGLINHDLRGGIRRTHRNPKKPFSRQPAGACFCKTDYCFIRRWISMYRAPSVVLPGEKGISQDRRHGNLKYYITPIPGN